MKVRVLRKMRGPHGWGGLVFDVTVAELEYLIHQKKAGLALGLCDRGPVVRVGPPFLRRRICSIHVVDEV